MILDVEFIENVQDFDVEFGENIENTTELEAQIKTLNAQIAALEQYATKAYEAGRKSQYDELWDDFQANGTRGYYADAFRSSTMEYCRPKYKIRPTERGGGSRVFYACKKLKKVEAEYIDFSQVPRGNYISEGYYNTFTMCYELEEIEDVGFIPTFGYGSTFNVCKKLRKIAVIRTDAETQFLADTFSLCDALEELTIEGTIGQNINLQWSKKLTLESLVSILTHLFNFNGSGEEWSRKIILAVDSWNLLEAQGAVATNPVTGEACTWIEYVEACGWLRE